MLNKLFFARAASASLAFFLVAGCDKMGSLTEAEHLQRAETFYAQGQPRAGMIEIKNVLQKSPESPGARHLLAKLYLDLGHGPAAEQEILRAKKAAPQDMALDMTLAETRLAQRKYDAVLAALDPAKYPNERARVLQLRGEALLGLGRPTDACSLFEQSQQADSRFVPALWGRAKCAVGRDDPVAAKTLLDQALKIDAKNPRTWAYLADLERTRKDFKAATAAYTEALRLRPALMDALIGRAAVAIQDNQIAAAEKDIKTLNSIVKDTPASQLLQGMLFYKQQKYTQAKASFDSILKNSPDFMPAVLWDGFASYAAKNYGQASKHFYKYLQEFPDAYEVRAIQALTQARLGNSSEVTALLKDIDPASVSDPQSLTMVGLAYMQLGNRDLGTRYLSEVVQRNPNSPASRISLAQALMTKGDVAGAMRELEAAISLTPKEPQPQILLIQMLTNAKRYEEALRAIERVRPLLSEPAIVPNARGTIYVLQGRTDLARKEFEESLRQKPGFPPAAHNLAQLEIRAGHLDLAKNLYREALKNFPDDANVLQALVSLEKQTNQPEAAKTVLETALKRRPSDSVAAVLLAREYLSQANPDKALAVTQQAANANTVDAALLEVRGAAYLMRGDDRAALAQYQRLANEQPDSPDAYYFLALGQVAANDFGAARDSLKRSLQLKPDQLRVEASLARIDIKEGRYDEAQALVRQMKQNHPEVAEAALVEAELLVAQKRDTDAIVVLEQAVKTHPKAPGLALRLAQAQWAAGQKERALGTAKAQLLKNAADVEAALFLAEASDSLGRLPDARAHYETALRQQPNNRRALNNLAWLLRDSDPAKATALANQAFKIAPGDPNIADTLGWLMMSQGNPARAEVLLKQAADGAPSNLSYQYHYALVLQKSGKSRNAERILNEIVLKPFAEREQALALLASIRSPR